MTHSLIQHRRQIYRQRTLQLMLSGDEASLADIVRILRDDSALSTTVLEKATDAQVSDSAPVYHLQRAVQLLGFRRVRALIDTLATAV